MMCNSRPERAKALPKHHSFALAGRIFPFPTTQGVALGYELVALSGRFNRTTKIYVQFVEIRVEKIFAKQPQMRMER
ncbi:MAG: hypothetical protein IKI26_04795 [Prevotella sp.]|nr:hypothetical protein [Prevotella sp.]